MEKNIVNVKDIMDSIVPITRFNRGEANKIFDEVNEKGVKVVLKNSVPACVLVQPERYDAMIEALEDYALYMEAERRMKEAEGQSFLSQEEVLHNLGITEEDLAEIEVEIE